MTELRPDVTLVDSGGGMPAFGGRLRKAQIDALATYVAGSTRTK